MYISSNNLFPCDIQAACEKFFQTLEAVQKQKLEVGQIGRAYRDTLNELKKQVQHMQSLAADDMTEHVCLQLEDFMQEYAAHKALYQFLDGAASGWTLHRGTPGLQERIKEKLEQKHGQVSSLLYQTLNKGRAQREKERAREAQQAEQEKMQRAEQAIERAYGRNQDLYKSAMQAFNQLDAQAKKNIDDAYQAVRDAHGDARKSLKVARKAVESEVQQVQGIIPQVMDPVVKLADSVNGLLKSNNEYLKQQSPSFQEEAAVRADKRRRDAKLSWVLFLLGVIGAFWALGFLLIQHFPH